MNDSRVIDEPRRRLVLGSMGLVAASGLASHAGESGATTQKPLPTYADWKNANDVIVHSAQTIETERGAFGTGVITPNDILFVRNNLAPPADIDADREAWQVRIEGVRKPATLSVAQLRRLGVTAVPMVLQCSGNGRGFFAHKASGTQWRTGASGCVIFSGVPVAAIVRELGGVADGMKFITGTGGETIPPGIDPKTVMVERSVPIALNERAILAWELNGEPLPVAHGGPLRLVVPGYYGINNVKYVKQLAFTAAESPAAIQQTGYRVRPIGTKGAPDQPSMWAMAVKSFITQPVDTDAPASGPVQIIGVAFGGERPVRSVDVSLDGGKTWQAASLFGPDLGPYAWRQFALSARLAPGKYVLASRATDTAGNAQPADRLENERAYGNRSWRDHAVTVGVR